MPGDEQRPVPRSRLSARGVWAVVREQAEFMRAFLRAPAQTGAICPSSRALARAMVAGSRLDQARLVAELGPGTGVFTRVILEAVGPQTRVFALEINEQAAARLRQRYPQVEVIHDSAEALPRYVEQSGLGHADCVISGLPWAAMSAEAQARIMRNVVAALAPGGVFTTFAYLHARSLPAGRRYRRLLGALFREERVSAVVWRNVPPALVYRCVK